MSSVIQQSIGLQQRIVDGIVASAEGMFLLARLHCETFVDATSEAGVESILRNLRSGFQALDVAYDNALQRIDGQLEAHRLLGRRAISWVTYCRRLLTTTELRHAVAILNDSRNISKSGISTIGDILAVCAGLLVLDEGIGVVRLVHYTTQEYLERVRSQWVPEAEVQLAQACLTYLSFDTFLTGIGVDYGKWQQSLRDCPLFDYCGRYWGVHVRPVQQNVLDQTIQFVLRRETLESIRNATNDEYAGWGYFDTKKLPHIETALHAAATQGLAEVVKKLLITVSSIDINLKDDRGRTPLALAASAGHEDVVKVLTELEGVDVNTQNAEGRTPLFLAVYGGYERVTKILLEHPDLDLNLRARYGLTPLLSAVQLNQIEMVNLLAKYEAVDLNLRYPLDWHTPLSLAAFEGYESVVRILLERKDLDLNFRDQRGRTPLMFAVQEDHEEIVKMLVKSEAVETNTRDLVTHHTPLSWAASKGNGRIVKILLERKDLDVDSRHYGGRTTLFRAVYMGQIDIVKLLLERADIDINSRDRFSSWTPLMSAAFKGYEEAVKMLVSCPGIDINPKDRLGQTPLLLAAAEGHEEVVKILLEWENIETKSKDRDGWTALSWAADRGHVGVERLLKAHRASDGNDLLATR